MEKYMVNILSSYEKVEIHRNIVETLEMNIVPFYMPEPFRFPTGTDRDVRNQPVRDASANHA